MNNRFRFRVWDNERKMYRLPSDNEPFWIGTRHMTGLDFSGVAGDYELEQCTGWKDTNNKLIYENDVVGFHYYMPNGEWDAGQGVIVWYNSGWAIKAYGEYLPLESGLAHADPQGIEILGTVHDKKVDCDE